jgi:hypothetical protein
MPQIREEQELSNDGSFALVERKVKERNDFKTTQYRKPVTFQAMLTMLQAAKSTPGFSYRENFPVTKREDETEETEQSFYLTLFQNALDKWAAADVYKSLAAESTTITVAGEKLDLMTVPVADLIDGYNGTMNQVRVRAKLKGGTPQAIADAEKSVGSIPAWRAVARKLVEGYQDENDKHVAPVARLEGDKLVAL